MAVTFVDDAVAGNNVSSGALTVAVTVSNITGLTEGDYVVAFLRSSSTVQGSPLDGFTLLGTIRGTPDNFLAAGVTSVWGRVATSSEPTTYRWQIADQGVPLRMSLACLAFRGTHPSSPLAGVGLQRNGASSKSTAPSVTHDATAGMLVCAFANGAATTFSTPVGMTGTLTADSRVRPAYVQVVTAGDTGPKTITKTDAGASHGASVVLRSANRPPNAPTVYVGEQTSGLVDMAASTTRVAFSDPDPGDSRSAVAIRVIQDGGSVQYVDLSGPSLSGTEVKNATTASSWDLSAVLTNGSAWQIAAKDWDQADTEGTYGAYQSFTGSAKPTMTWTTAATIDDDATPALTWNYADAEGDLQQAYRVLVFPATLPDGTDATLFDDPAVWAAEAEYDTGRVLSDAETAVTTPLVNGDYVAWGYVEQTGGLRSEWTVDTFVMDLPPPPAPSVSAVFNDATGRIEVTVRTSANLESDDDALYAGSSPSGTGTWQSAEATLTRQSDGSLNAEAT